MSYNHGHMVVGEIRPSAAGPPRHRRRRPETETTVPGPLVGGAVERSQETFSHSDPTAAPNAALHIPPRAYGRCSPFFHRSVCACVIPNVCVVLVRVRCNNVENVINI